jgi:hypothetical protein|tara:strand:+ start:248 stop:397 length:150 start_codon:yes stop_codon:yes gene_type:complete
MSDLYGKQIGWWDEARFENKSRPQLIERCAKLEELLKLSREENKRLRNG